MDKDDAHEKALPQPVRGRHEKHQPKRLVYSGGKLVYSGGALVYSRRRRTRPLLSERCNLAKVLSAYSDRSGKLIF